MIQSDVVQTTTSDPQKFLKHQFEGIQTAGISATVLHRLAFTLTATAGGGVRLTVTDSKDQREVKMEGLSPSVRLSRQILTSATQWPAEEDGFIKITVLPSL